MNLITQFLTYVRANRGYGQTYVHKWVRDALPTGRLSARIGDRSVILSYKSWGRSLYSGGNKYKAHAYYKDTGKPVPTKDLHLITE